MDRKQDDYTAVVSLATSSPHTPVARRNGDFTENERPVWPMRRASISGMAPIHSPPQANTKLLFSRFARTAKNPYVVRQKLPVKAFLILDGWRRDDGRDEDRGVVE